MKSYMIGYDLNTPGKDYADLIEAIREKFKPTGFWHHLDSTWIVKSDETAVQIRNYLKPFLDSNDELLVVRLSDESAWAGFNTAGSEWLRKYLPTSKPASV
jgi:hypothetical protein